MSTLTGRLKREHETFRCMARIYCHDHHGQESGLCDACQGLMDYAERRLEKCPYGQHKPTCAKCPIHCYKARQREQSREIMRYAGPRMTLRHPLRSLGHLTDKLRRVRHPMELRARNPRGRKAACTPGSEPCKRS
ncbi:MAG: nitrous oxide-stimulated promoter family protein [Lysobacterales bacterium]|jgi:hypothetical protein